MATGAIGLRGGVGVLVGWAKPVAGLGDGACIAGAVRAAVVALRVGVKGGIRITRPRITASMVGSGVGCGKGVGTGCARTFGLQPTVGASVVKAASTRSKLRWTADGRVVGVT